MVKTEGFPIFIGRVRKDETSNCVSKKIVTLEEKEVGHASSPRKPVNIDFLSIVLSD